VNPLISHRFPVIAQHLSNYRFWRRVRRTRPW